MITILQNRQTREAKKDKPLPKFAAGLFDRRKEVEQWVIMSSPHLREGLAIGIDLAQSQIEGRFASNYLIDMPAARRHLEEFALDNALASLRTTENDLQKLLRKALANGWSNQQLAESIADKYNNSYRGYRALSIARTEMTGIINFGNTFTLEEEGVKTKRWIATLDDRTRDTHAELDGDVEPIDGYFDVGGESAEYPADASLSAAERVNCRCTTVAGDFDVKREKNYTKLFLRQHGARERHYEKAIKRYFTQQMIRVTSQL